MEKRMNERHLSEIQDKLGYFFGDPDLLVQSLTHSSYANENMKSGIASNERLEFLGDSLLGMTVAVLIYESKPELTEGQMTKLRAELVCEKSLAALANELSLGEYILLGHGEDIGGGRRRPSILADALEAVLAAIYLDSGFEPTMRFVSDHFKRQLDDPLNSNSDYKTILQEMIQEKPGQTHLYDLIGETGPDHDKTFTVELKLNGKPFGTGKGKNKKSAEQAAAKAAIHNIAKQNSNAPNPVR